MRKDNFRWFMIGAGILSLAVHFGPTPANRVVSACEENLPRNQKCVLTAVPEEPK
jgi:hypothetical protein